MREMFKIALTLGAVALLGATPAPAQGPRGGFGGGGGGGLMLLNNPGVREELKLTDEQVGKVTKSGQELREKYRDEFASLRDASSEDRREKGEALMKKVQEEGKQTYAAILTADQARRLEQIQRQQNVLQALTADHVRSELKLSDDQVGKIKEVRDDHQKAARAAMGDVGRGASQDDRRKAFEKVNADRKEAAAKAMAVLTDGQKATWKELTGEPFEVKWEGPGRGNR